MAGTSSRGNPRMGDVVRSVAVISVVVLGLWLVGRFLTVTPDSPTPPVDYVQSAQEVAQSGVLDPLVPGDLPRGWRANGAGFSDDVWNLGFVTSDDRYVGVQQSRSAAERDLLDAFARGSRRDGEARIGGATWSRWVRENGEPAFTTRQGDTTVLVSGSVRESTMRDFAAGLRPVASR